MYILKNWRVNIAVVLVYIMAIVYIWGCQCTIPDLWLYRMSSGPADPALLGVLRQHAGEHR